MTRTNRPTVTSGAGAGADFGPDDDPTVIDASWEGQVTPVEIPRCAECGSAVFEDDFTDVALAIGLDRCVRSKPTAERPWHWCAGYSPTHRKLVQLIPR